MKIVVGVSGGAKSGGPVDSAGLPIDSMAAHMGWIVAFPPGSEIYEVDGSPVEIEVTGYDDWSPETEPNRMVTVSIWRRGEADSLAYRALVPRLSLVERPGLVQRQPQ